MTNILVYTTQKRDFNKIASYQNPRFWEDGYVHPKVDGVIIVGEWPRIAAAYEQAKIPVLVVKNTAELNQALEDREWDAAPRHSKGEGDEDFVIPPEEELESMIYRDLREIVARVDPKKHVTSKKEALKFLNDRRDEEDNE